MPSIGRIPEKKKDPWAAFEDAPETQAAPAGNGWDDFEDAPESKFRPEQINANYEAPASVRLEVSGLEKPEDQLAAIQKHYPDAERYDGDNFIMTNPDNGEVMLMNHKSWWPSAGDFAASVPTIAEGVGAGVGGILGGAGGATAGSAAPVVGTAAGGVAGAMAGAGVGGATGRDLTQRGINWFYGNDDTRTLSEYAKDKALDVGINAAGEGAGMAIAKGVGLAAKPVKGWIAGKADDAAEAVTRAKDFTGANVTPTVGQVSQNKGALLRESKLAANPESRVSQRLANQTAQLNDEFARISNGVATVSDPSATILTKQGAGEGLIGKAREADALLKSRNNDLYSEVDKIVGDVRSAGGTNTQTLLQRLNSEKKALGESAKMNKGPLLDDAIAQTKAASSDLKKGISFRDAQDMRSGIGKIAFDKNTDPYTAARFRDLYKAVSQDMEATAKSVGDDAFAKWKEADAFNVSLFAKDGPRTGIKGLLKAPSGQDAYNLITKGIKDGDKSLRAAREQIEAAGGASNWDQTVGSYLDQIGMHPTTSGEKAFSEKKFVQEWNKISPEAKDAMFAGTGRQQYRQDLDRLSRIIDARQQGAKVKGRVETGGDRLLNWFSGGTIPAAKAIRNNFMDKLLTNPQVVQWMTKVPQAQMQRGGLLAHVDVLRNIGREALKAGTDDGRDLYNAVNTYLNQSGFREDQDQ